MKCSFCDATISDGSTVCEVCETPLESATAKQAKKGEGKKSSSKLMPCPDCGHKVSRRAITCPYCGAPIGSSQQVAFPGNGHDGSKVTTQGTGKDLKLQLIGASFLIFIGAIWLMIAYLGYDPIQLSDHALFDLGILAFIYVKTMIWWKHS